MAEGVEFQFPNNWILWINRFQAVIPAFVNEGDVIAEHKVTAVLPFCPSASANP
jgi:hypothetical protein